MLAGVATSVDAFYGGRFDLVQPVGTGLRSGLDALLLAAALPSQASGRLADLGSGSGAVALAASCRAPAVAATLVEASATMAELARRTLVLEANRHLADRLSVVETDLLQGREARERAGLFDGAFDHVLTNPPYHRPGQRLSPDQLRVAATVAADADFLVRWIRVAAALLRPGGGFRAILRADALPDVLAAATRYVGGVRVLAVHARPQLAAHRLLLAGTKGSRAPFRLLPPVALHDETGRPNALSDAISAGSATLALGN